MDLAREAEAAMEDGSFAAVVVGAMAALSGAKALAGARRPGTPGYAFGSTLWAVEAAAYIVLVGNFYWHTLRVVGELSDRYKALLVDELRARPAESGLHESWLSPWIGGRLMDLKDAQYHAFRDMLPAVAALMAVHLAASHGLRAAVAGLPLRSQVAARGALMAAFSLAAGVHFHGADLLKVLGLALANFALCRATVRRGRLAPVLLWAFNIGILYTNDRYKGYQWAALLGPASPLAAWLDARRGSLPWHHTFNLMMLRMMSFNLDYWWMVRRTTEPAGAGDAVGAGKDGAGKPLRVERPSAAWAVDPSAGRLDEGARARDYHPEDVYCDPVLYLSYLMYVPLYISGPTITFNSFVSFLAAPQRTYSLRGKLVYAVRFLGVLLVFEVLTHYVYAGALSFMAFRRKVPDGKGKTALLVFLTRREDGALDYAQVAYYSYWALMYLWFKFLLIWRLFRLWAVCDDVEPVENMGRCMNNNYTVGGFWRNWHRSFNRWLVRYMYVPLGGNSAGVLGKIVNVLLCFTFVGFWHDLKPELFAWGWLLSVFFVPEIVALRVARWPSVRDWAEASPIAASWVVAVCGACNIVMLKVANIVGYTTGLDGAAMLLPALRTRAGVLFVLEYLLYMAVGVQVMLFIERTRAGPPWRAARAHAA